VARKHRQVEISLLGDYQTGGNAREGFRIAIRDTKLCTYIHMKYLEIWDFRCNAMYITVRKCPRPKTNCKAEALLTTLVAFGRDWSFVPLELPSYLSSTMLRERC
jgi:hypothetical protein